jgi:hypothetical protein
MGRFPKLEKEKTCRMEREMRQQARESYRKKLYEAYGKTEILEGGDKGASKAAEEV